MSAPDTTNQPATDANKFLHEIIFGVAVKAAEAEIIAAAPVMGLPILKQLDEVALQIIAQKIYEALAQGATFAIIDAQTSIEAAAANQAATVLKTALSGDDPNAIETATQNFESAFGKLIHYDGSANP